jgi:hypothetical protein
MANRILIIVSIILLILSSANSFAKNLIVEDKMSVAIISSTIDYIEAQKVTLDQKQQKELYNWIFNYAWSKYGSFVTLQSEIMTNPKTKENFHTICLEAAYNIKLKADEPVAEVVSVDEYTDIDAIPNFNPKIPVIDGNTDIKDVPSFKEKEKPKKETIEEMESWSDL